MCPGPCLALNEVKGPFLCCCCCRLQRPPEPLQTRQRVTQTPPSKEPEDASAAKRSSNLRSSCNFGSFPPLALGRARADSARKSSLTVAFLEIRRPPARPPVQFIRIRCAHQLREQHRRRWGANILLQRRAQLFLASEKKERKKERGGRLISLEPTTRDPERRSVFRGPDSGSHDPAEAQRTASSVYVLTVSVARMSPPDNGAVS